MTSSSLNFEEKPFLRGRFHEASFFFGLGACVMLIAAANTEKAIWATTVYSICMGLMFGVSSLYHRITWADRMKPWLRKLDHSAIYIFIAGTATPISLLGLKGSQGLHLLMIFWGAALAGVLKEFLWKNAPRWSSGIFYVGMGWLATPYIGQLVQSMGVLNIWLFIFGGIIYTLGAVIYSIKWPNPSPRIFGYHEIFHLFVIVACLFHFLVIYDLVTRV